jgi:hypothetical protein
MSDLLEDLNEVRTSALVEGIAGASMQLGIVAGLEEAAAYIRETSGKLYAKGMDENAAAYRMLANMLDRLAAEKRASYDSIYRPDQKRYFEELERRLPEEDGWQ